MLALLPVPAHDRVPALFGGIEVLCLAVLAALAVKRLAPQPTRRSHAAVVLLAAAIVFDGWAFVPVVPVPRPVPVALDADPVIELPTRGWVEDAAAMYRATMHRRPLVNGYSGYFPPHYAQLQRDLRNGCVASLDGLRGGRSLDAVVWRADPDAVRIDAALHELWSTARREETPDVVIYRVPRSASDPTPQSPTAACGARP
jgi:hypothetical protein